MASTTASTTTTTTTTTTTNEYEKGCKGIRSAIQGQSEQINNNNNKYQEEDGSICKEENDQSNLNHSSLSSFQTAHQANDQCRQQQQQQVYESMSVKDYQVIMKLFSLLHIQIRHIQPVKYAL